MSSSFKVGDFVTGVPNDTAYTITNDKAICMVVRERNDRVRDIDVLVLFSRNDSDVMGIIYNVKSNHFVLTNIEDWDVDNLGLGAIKGSHLNGILLCNGVNVTSQEYINRYYEVGVAYTHKPEWTFIPCGDVIPNEEKIDYMVDPNGNIDWDEDNIKDLADEVENLMCKYEDKNGSSYEYNYDVLNKYVRECHSHKSWIEEFMSNHDNYDYDTHTIQLVSTFKRETNRKGIEEFHQFIIDRLGEKIAEDYSIPKLSEKDIKRYEALRNQLNKYKTYIRKIQDYFGYDVWNKITIDNVSYREMNIRMEDLKEEINAYSYYINSETINDVRVTPEGYNLYLRSCDILYHLLCRTNFNDRITDEQIRHIKSYHNVDELLDTIKPVAGQKISTIIKKFAKYFGIDKYVKMETITWTTQDGEQKSREKDMGWNYRFTKFCDDAKPLEKKFKVVLSVNPIDYLTMSFGSDWASCMTIDKTNQRGMKNNYEGCYSGGTVDYALDDATVVMYLLPEDYNGDKPYLEGKIKRCLFFIGEDKFVQSRVYPDGRDGSDFPNIKTEMTTVMRKIFETCNKELDSNGWTLDHTNHYLTRSGDLHYADYREYSDAHAMSLNSKIKNPDYVIKVGNPNAFCLCCGSTNDRADSIVCSDCYGDGDYIECDYCGARFNEDDGYYAGDRAFCCVECREEAGYYYCEDTGEYEYEDYCYYDEIDGYYYSDNDDLRVITYDGNIYHGDDHAERAGYRYADSRDGWYLEEDVFYCENCGQSIYVDDWNSEYECCDDCAEEIMAEEEEENVA